jgi:hypothetical protein
MRQTEKLKQGPFDPNHDITLVYTVAELAMKTPAWYTLFNGPGSLEELAAKVGYPALYEILYRGFSPSSHGNNIVPGKISFPDGPQVNLEPLRDKTQTSSTVNHCLQISNLTFRSYLEKRVPFMAKSYQAWVAYAYPYSTQLNNEVSEMIKKEDQWLLDRLELNKRPPINYVVSLTFGQH